MTGVISAAFSRTGAVFVALLVLCGFGYVSYLDIPKEATPDVDIPVAYVSVGYEGISPEDSERLLVKPLEKHLRSVQGLDKMSSVASEGYASVSLNSMPARTSTASSMMCVRRWTTRSLTCRARPTSRR